eukprot:TCONS_00003513-protein
MYNIVRYQISKHGKEVQNLLDKYMIPVYLKRMGLTAEQQKDHASIEYILDPKGAYNSNLDGLSLVVLDENETVRACQTNYYIDVEKCKRELTEFKQWLASCDIDRQSKLWGYLEQRNEFFDDYTKLMDKLTQRMDIARFLCIESTIIDPKWRGRGLASILHKKSAYEVAHNEMAILEGMMPNKYWQRRMEYHKNYCGFTLFSKSVAYDDYACPAWYKLPNDTEK